MSMRICVCVCPRASVVWIWQRKGTNNDPYNVDVACDCLLSTMLIYFLFLFCCFLSLKQSEHSGVLLTSERGSIAERATKKQTNNRPPLLLNFGAKPSASACGVLEPRIYIFTHTHTYTHLNALAYISPNRYSSCPFGHFVPSHR